MAIKIIPPQPENIDKILQIDAVTGGKWDKTEFYNFLNENRDTQRNRIYLAEDEGVVTGFITAEFPVSLDDPIIIKKICVNKNARLKGAGRKLFSHIYDMAALRKYTTVELIFDEKNNDGLRFIKKIARISKSVAKSGQYHITIFVHTPTN